MRLNFKDNDAEKTYSSTETPIGMTKETPSGFQVAITSVKFGTGPQRIRMTLLRDGQRVRHLDVTTEVARDLAPLLRKAGELGAAK